MTRELSDLTPEQAEKRRAYQKAYRETNRDQRAEYGRAWRAGNHGYSAAHGKARRESHPEQCAEAIRVWHAEHPNARKAHKAVAAAIKKGTLHPKPCCVCRSEKVVAHHQSYLEADWLRVWWLCQSHHQELHAVVRGERSLPSEVS